MTRSTIRSTARPTTRPDPHPTAAVAGTGRAARRWPWWALRLGVTAQAALVCLQPVLAGRFLTGDYPMLILHRANGITVGVAASVNVVLALLAWRLGRAPGRVMVAATVLFAATGEQIHAGFARNLGLHVPLGVTVVSLTVWFAVWLWRNGRGERAGPASDAAPDVAPDEPLDTASGAAR